MPPWLVTPVVNSGVTRLSVSLTLMLPLPPTPYMAPSLPAHEPNTEIPSVSRSFDFTVYPNTRVSVPEPLR